MSVQQTLDTMILSASGWRGVFAADGDEESSGGDISADHGVIAAAAARVFAAYLAGTGGGRPLVLIGRDTRPTGEAIAGRMIRAFIAAGCEVRFAGVTAAPEIMARARNFSGGRKGAGFVYISASHNPRGHNGFKFGLTDGGVLPGPEAAKLTARLRELLARPDAAAEETPEAAAEFARVLAGEAAEKEAARQDYYDFALETAGDESIAGAVRAGLAERPLGIAADLNGSARTLSIDRAFITGFGARYSAINAEPGVIAHRIVPEGESLEPCREFLEARHAGDPSFVLGYVPDCDGDRGNLVIWDEGRARTLEAQEVFALACVSELAHLVRTGEAEGRKVAVAVNDPTSLRIDAIAGAFGAKVFRAEVGEANVVSLARKLREEGYVVRILGEGSAGGNITHPAAVRDPLNTIMAMMKLLAIRGDRGFFALWCARSGQEERYRPDFTFSGIIATLPSYISTGAYTEDAILRVRTADHALLKERYQGVFLREWETRKDYLAERYGITGWEAAAYQGIRETRGISRFGDAGRGGLRIVFSKGREETACIWMRGSGTEPVFRVMADAPGPDPRLERDLIQWQRRMVTEADGS
ncbi:MAG: phosphatidylglycerol lysyltransferase [Spirochaetaceae bacterium]|jgi:phosphoglucomutase|nr:phosphatidylglycerol lysyltransferase [Spirochaetaceae bacterium]